MQTCTDDRMDKRLPGFPLIRRAEKGREADSAAWNARTVLDRVHGKTYKLRLMPIESGKQLQVVGAPAFGRTRTHIRTA